MKNYLVIISLSFLIILSSCTEAQEELSTQKLLEEIKVIETQFSDRTSDKILNQEEKIDFWKEELNKDKYASNKVAKLSHSKEFRYHKH